MKLIKSFAKDLFNQVSEYRYHRVHREAAKKILNNIESVKGKTDSILLKLSDEYARDVLGWQGYAPWLYVYSAVAESFKEGWIPDNYYNRIVLPSLTGHYGNISDLKSLTNKIFEEGFFPDIVYHVNGKFIANNYEIILEKDIKDILFRNSDKIVYKIDNSLQGRGVFFLEKNSFDLKKIKEQENGVYQEYIEQHDLFDKIMPNSVATVRLTTVSENEGNISVRAGYLRIGRNTDTHIKSNSHIRVPINISSGEFDVQGYLTSWQTILLHPDTNVTFANKFIPSFNKFLKAAIDLHKSIPYISCIGWDMIIDKNDKIKVMEWNGNHNDIKFSEATQGPCFLNLGWEQLWYYKKSINNK